MGLRMAYSLRICRVNQFMNTNNLVKFSRVFGHRCKSTAAAVEDVKASATEHHHQQPTVDLTFNNAKEAYRSKTTGEILRGLLVFNLCSIPILVNKSDQLMRWGKKVLGKTLFCKIMQMTFYGHFVAGADQVAIRPLVHRNKLFGVKSILDYSVEQDLTSEEATEAEMRSCAPLDDGEADVPLSTVDPLRKRFIAHEKFGDRREKVVSARTYFYEDEANCDKHTEIFLRCIDAVAGATEPNTGFVAIKMTALGRPHFLLRLSDVLISTRNFFEKFSKEKQDPLYMHFGEEDFEQTLDNMGVSIPMDERKKWFTLLDVNQDGKIDLLDWDNLLEVNMSMSKMLMVPNTQSGKLEPIITCLSETEEEQLKNMLHRVNEIAEYATKKQVRVMVDAEQTYFQPAISRLTMEMMRKFNKEKAVIFNTYQCYLKSAFANASIDMDLAKREDFYFGAKLVRGAYMDQERERAREIGYEDPINPSFEDTTEMYNRVLSQVFKNIHSREKGKVAVMIATHNENTIRFTVERMREYNVVPADKLLCFGQLLGMCDQVSFPLGQAGYSVYKYVPYGPVEDVLPYLSRRAKENKGIIKKVQKEKRLLREELIRRIKTGNLRYDPLKHMPIKN